MASKASISSIVECKSVTSYVFTYFFAINKMTMTTTTHCLFLSRRCQWLFLFEQKTVITKENLGSLKIEFKKKTLIIATSSFSMSNVTLKIVPWFINLFIIYIVYFILYFQRYIPIGVRHTNSKIWSKTSARSYFKFNGIEHHLFKLFRLFIIH